MSAHFWLDKYTKKKEFECRVEFFAFWNQWLAQTQGSKERKVKKMLELTMDDLLTYDNNNNPV